MVNGFNGGFQRFGAGIQLKSTAKNFEGPSKTTVKETRPTPPDTSYYDPKMPVNEKYLGTPFDMRFLG